jgi:hypothetical protein
MSPVADLLVKTLLILWDEAPMADRNCFEALDKSLRDILRFKHANSYKKPCGGMTVVLGGDFRQILPVVRNGRREHIINASIKRSYLWQHFEVFHLTKNTAKFFVHEPNTAAEDCGVCRVDTTNWKWRHNGLLSPMTCYYKREMIQKQ